MLRPLLLALLVGVAIGMIAWLLVAAAAALLHTL
jgi:hypothetical protein